MGELAPDFTVYGPDGKAVKLSDFRGKTVLIDIWATWCGPCVASMPHNSELAEKFAKDGLVILAICADDSRANYDGWVKRNAAKYKFLTAHDADGKDGWDKSVFNTQYGVTGFPTLFLIDKEGRFVGQTSGGGPGENPHVSRLLAKGGVPVDISHLPPEEKRDPSRIPASIPMMGKTAAMPTGSVAASGKSAAVRPPTISLGNLKFDAEVPDFAAIGTDGKEVKLSSFKGRPVLVAFWTGARAPADDIAKLAATYKDQNLAVWAINVATDRAEFDTWAKANAAALGYTVSWDPAGKAFMESLSYMKFGIGMYPAFMVVNAEGYFRGGLIGMGEKVATWTRHSLLVADLKLTAEDQAAVNKGMQELFDARDKAPAAAAAAPVSAAAPKLSFRESYGKLKAGDSVPDFTVITPEGKEAKFSDYAKGKTVVIDLWATWCGPCIAVLPHYQEMSVKYRDAGVVFLGVCSFDTREAFDKWHAANREKFTFPLVFDPAGKPSQADKTSYQRTLMWQLSGGVITPLPTTLVVNPEGKFVGSYVGAGDSVSDSLGHLLLRSGVNLQPADRPKAVAAATIMAKPSGPAPASPPPATLAAGAVAPDFSMQTVDGKQLKLSDFKGKIVILDFWATWCGPCISSFPHTQKIAEKYKDQDVVILASGTSDKTAKFNEWIPKNQPKYPDMVFAYDTNERDSATFDERASSKLYHVVGIPTQFVIGRDGKIVATIVGNGGEKDARSEAALARAGVKVDAEQVAAGEKQLKADADAAVARAAAAREEAKNPTPKFRESFGKLKAGDAVADFTVETADRVLEKFSALSQGKTVVLSFWNAGNGIGDQNLAFIDTWARKHADQGVLFLGVGAYDTRESFDQWLAANASKFSFPIVFDPAGGSPKPPKPMDEMSDDEKKAWQAISREYFQKVIALQITGGAMAPIPNNTVIDSQGRMVGFYVGAGPQSAESLGNLLLRAGIKLAPEDMPAKIFTAAETKEAPPEPKVETLKIGAMAPDFVTQDLEGKNIVLSAYRGKVVVLDFWATWCGPCMTAMPHTQEIAAHYKDQGVVVLGSCTSDTRAKFEAWVKANLEKYPDIIWSHDQNEKGADRASRKHYGVSGIPTQFIIDRDGKVVDIVVGYMKGEAILDAALAKAGVKVDPALVAKGEADLKKRAALR